MPSKTKEVPLPREVSSPHFVLRLAAQLALSAFGFDLALRMVCATADRARRIRVIIGPKGTAAWCAPQPTSCVVGARIVKASNVVDRS